MLRRQFIRRASLFSLPVLLGGHRLSALTAPFFAPAMNEDGRVLVLLQLSGGNDGLNTLIPLDQYAGLSAARANLLIPENRVLALDDTRGLHPAMTGIRGLYDQGKVAVVQGVGYENPNRSHFRSTDIWNTASAADEVLTEGWLGRHFDERFPGFPGGYPNAEQPSPFAIVMGNAVSETCQGSSGNFSTPIRDVDNVGQLPDFGGTADPATPYGRELAWLRETIGQSNAYAGGIEAAVRAGNTLADYPEDNEVAAKLRDVARLISGGLQTKVFIVELGGFDTHANQTPEGDTTVGEHADLLGTLSAAVAAFQDDLEQLGLADRVLGMTYSEFGRRIRSNASQGSDHGDAAPLFLFGNCVTGGVTGDNPAIDPAVGPNEGVPMQYDFRNVYGSVLMDWFGVPEGSVQRLLVEDFAYVPLLANCRPTSAGQPTTADRAVALAVAPNPARTSFEVVFTTGAERARLSLFDGLGRRVRVVTDRRFGAGEHRVLVDVAGLPDGVYFVHLTLAGGVRKTRRVVKG